MKYKTRISDLELKAELTDLNRSELMVLSLFRFQTELKCKESELTSPSDTQRLCEKIDFSMDCWNWKGCRNRRGYSKYYLKGKLVYGHRIMFRLFHGGIPRGKVVHHKCENTSCVNPAHLAPLSNRENVVLGRGNVMATHRAGVCKMGHKLTQSKDGRMRCGECRLARNRNQYSAKKDAINKRRRELRRIKRSSNV